MSFIDEPPSFDTSREATPGRRQHRPGEGDAGNPTPPGGDHFKAGEQRRSGQEEIERSRKVAVQPAAAAGVRDARETGNQKRERPDGGPSPRVEYGPQADRYSG